MFECHFGHDQVSDLNILSFIFSFISKFKSDFDICNRHLTDLDGKMYVILVSPFANY